MKLTEKTAFFPPVGDYHHIVGMLLSRCIGFKILPPLPTTKRTVEIGSRNSPDMVCTPFKIMLGNQIEALEHGANLLVMPAAGCRLGFYDILQKQILTDMGYEFEMLPLFDYIPNAGRLFKALKDVNPELTQERFDSVLACVVRVVLDMDVLADHMRRNMAFEVKKGEHQRIYDEYLAKAIEVQSVTEAEELGKRYHALLRSVAVNKPDRPIRIGIVGEMYAVMEPSSNCYIEKWFAEHGVEIVRPIDLTRVTAALYTVPEQIENSGGYVTYNVGSTANDSIMRAYEMARDGSVDGIVHIKPASCSPEITAMTIFQNIARDYNIPFIYLTFDIETSEAGLHTRLEAFHDMILMKGLKP